VHLPLYYTWRSLLRQKLSRLLTFVVVTMVVFVLSVLLSFAAGIRASLAATGSPRNLLVLKAGSKAESTSLIFPEESSRLMQCPGVALDATGVPLVSLELCVQISLPRRGSASRTNVAIRGVDPVGFVIHDEVRIVDGRPIEPGALEVIVGKAARDRYGDLQVGSEILLGRSRNWRFRIVGVFEAGGGALENEIWAPRTILADVYGRQFVSSAVLRLEKPGRADEAIRYVMGPAVELDARREPDYYADLSERLREIVLLVSILVGVMAFGAVFAVANTMYAAVDGRRREIAMLRTVGFGRTAIILAFLVESFLTCALACAAGLVACLLYHRPRQDFLSDITWTAYAFESRLTAGIALSAIGLAMGVGVIGGLAPAIKAARTGIIESLRKA
jgi:putative ABC transport system permease protein